MKKSNADLILEAIQDLHAQEQIVTRETLAEVCDLTMTTIDDRVAYLIDNGKVHRVQRGVFVPAPDHRPARMINKMILPDGTVKIEIGDDHVLTLTPREDRSLAALMVGAGQQFAAIEVGHHAAILASELSQQIKQLKRDLVVLTAKKGNLQPLEVVDVDATEATTKATTKTSTRLPTKKQIERRQKMLKASRQAAWREKERARTEALKRQSEASTETST